MKDRKLKAIASFFLFTTGSIAVTVLLDLTAAQALITWGVGFLAWGTAQVLSS